jgi:NAD(P)-dependent dehydrogenase (short-subunit alcohol dehydrogenase family)
MSKILLVTGASRGIGAATARLAAARGYDVALAFGTAEEAAEAVAADVRKVGRRAVTIQADVADPAQIKALFQTVDRDLGRLDAFLNNAGIFTLGVRFVDITTENLNRMIATNLTGAFVANQEAVRRMSKRLGGKGGVIVNMSSMAAKLGGPFDCVDYAASKGGVESMTVGMAKELAGEGIRVNGIRPGLIDTDIHARAGQPDRLKKLEASVPLGRGGTAGEVAEAALWLMSDAAAYVTGVTIDVAGGRGL